MIRELFSLETRLEEGDCKFVEEICYCHCRIDELKFAIKKVRELQDEHNLYLDNLRMNKKLEVADNNDRSDDEWISEARSSDYE